MKRAPQNTDGMERIASLIEEIAIGMLTWAEPNGQLTSRPMVPLEIDSEGALWFFTRQSPEKSAVEGRVNLAFARPDVASYVSVSGRATLLDDREKAGELWVGVAQQWFPQGPQDPALVLLRVDVDDAQFWDVDASEMVRLLDRIAQGTDGPPIDTGESGHVLNPQAPSALV